MERWRQEVITCGQPRGGHRTTYHMNHHWNVVVVVCLSSSLSLLLSYFILFRDIYDEISSVFIITTTVIRLAEQNELCSQACTRTS